MIDKISARDLEAIKGEGAKVTRKVTKASPAPPDEINKSLGRLTEAVMVAGKTEKVIALASERHLANIANSLGDGAKSLLDQLTQILARDESAKVVPYRFTVKRDSRGLIEHIEAHPITTKKA
jgi:hypothetical protein